MEVDEIAAAERPMLELDIHTPGFAHAECSGSVPSRPTLPPFVMITRIQLRFSTCPACHSGVLPLKTKGGPSK